MPVSATFHFRDEPERSASTAPVTAVAEVLLPSVGDLVWHRDSTGVLTMGRVARSITNYPAMDAEGAESGVVMNFMLERLPER